MVTMANFVTGPFLDLFGATVYDHLKVVGHPNFRYKPMHVYMRWNRIIIKGIGLPLRYQPRSQGLFNFALDNTHIW